MNNTQEQIDPCSAHQQLQQSSDFRTSLEGVVLHPSMIDVPAAEVQTLGDSLGPCTTRWMRSLRDPLIAAEPLLHTIRGPPFAPAFYPPRLASSSPAAHRGARS